MGALQGHSGGVRVDPTLQSNAEIPHGWTDYIYHVGSSGDRRSTVDADLLAGRTSGNQGSHTCFFMAVDLLSEPDVGPSCDIGRPRIVPYKPCGDGTMTLFYWFDLKIAQDERVVFRQTMSNAAILNYTIPADCLIKVVQEILYHKIRQSRRKHQKWFSDQIGRMIHLAREDLATLVPRTD